MSNRPNRSRRPGHDTHAPGADRRRTLLVIAAGVLLVVLVGVVVALGTADDEAADNGPDFAPVATDGAPLPELPDGGADPAVGSPAPLLVGTGADGEPITVGGGDEPTVVLFLAHWCPHCQREVTDVVGLMEDGDLDGVRVVAVLTGTDAAAPNHPPVAWLERESWAGEVMLDDERSTAASAYGLSGYPFAVYLDRDGAVVGRTSGGMGRAGILERVEALRAPG